MPRYIPIAVPAAMACSQVDLLAFDWSPNGVRADFGPTDDGQNAVRVTFSKACIVRLLDEMPLSTESEWSLNEGLVKDHLAYRVEGARFWAEQSEAFKIVHSGARHYRLITGWTCMDVVSAAEPTLHLVPLTPGENLED